MFGRCVVALMLNFASDRDACLFGCRAIVHLAAANVRNTQRLVAALAPSAVAGAMLGHPSDREIARYGCGALLGMSTVTV